MKRVLIFLVIIIALFTACNKRYMNIQILLPAQITLPKQIKKIGVANRSLPSNEDKFFNIVEGFLTGESIYADRQGSNECVRGFAAKINNSPRFNAVVIEGANLKGTGTREFPEPLEGNMVDQLCKQYGVDALILLEAFDSNIGFNEDKRNEKRKDKNGAEYIVVEYDAHLNINVATGWRVYDYTTRNIADENRFTDYKQWNSTGNSKSNARAKLPNKRDAINQSAYYSGERYAIRISPNWAKVSRYYFTKGHDDFKIARDFARVNNWDKAMEIWENLTTSSDTKIAGRACHNMALAYEMKGELDIALVWAKKAYSDFVLNSERSYINVLQNRITNSKVLDKQMN